LLPELRSCAHELNSACPHASLAEGQRHALKYVSRYDRTSVSNVSDSVWAFDIRVIQNVITPMAKNAVQEIGDFRYGIFVLGMLDHEIAIHV
jgi:hypothetical protein